MNIQRAMNAYGVGSKSESNAQGLEEALAKIGTKNTKGASEAGKAKSFQATVEAVVSESEIGMTSGASSDVYSKNNQNATVIQQEEDNRTEAEKAQEDLKETSNKASLDDMEMLINEGFDVFGMTPDELAAAIDRIKLQKEMYTEAIEGQVEAKQEQREAAVQQALSNLGNDPRAQRIAEKLVNSNLPVTRENVERITAALNLAGNVSRVSGDEAEYLIRNKLLPSIENVAAARLNAGTYAKKEHTLTDQAWAQLQPTVINMLFQAGVRSSKEMMAAAQDFIKKDIPLTAENLKAYSQITSIKLTDDDILTKAVDAISVGQDPKSANLLSSTAKQVRQVVRNTKDITGEAVDYAVAKRAVETGQVGSDKIDLTLEELNDAQAAVNAKDAQVAEYLTEYNSAGAGQGASIRARRQLEEIKAKMTFEAGYRLAKEGIRIDTVSMSRLIDELTVLENRFYGSFYKEAGMTPGVGDIELLKDTTEKLKSIEKMPAALVFDTVDRGGNISINELYSTGQKNSANYAYNQFAERLETVRTMPNAKFGDSISNASNAQQLLETAGVPISDGALRAVRILGYAQAEINAENVNKVSEYDEKLQYIIKEMHPAVTVRLIRDGINPLESSIDDLKTTIERIRVEEGVDSADTYSTFLTNLENRKNMTNEQRAAYTAIYRALHQIETSEESAVGNVYKGNQEMTLGNLLTAVRSGKAQGKESVVADGIKNLRTLDPEVNKIEKKISEGIGSKLTNLTPNENAALNKAAENADKVIEELVTNNAEAAKEAIDWLKDVAATGENATRFLEDFNILNTAENITAAKELLEGNTSIFEEWARFNRFATGEETDFPDMTEHMNSQEEMKNAYAELLKETGTMKENLQKDPALNKMDVKSLKKTNVGIRFMNRLSKREFYQIPVRAGGELVSMNVTVMNDPNNEKSKVMASVPTANLGKINAEATIENNKMKCFITSSTKEGMNVLKERQFNLFAELAQNGIQIGSIFYGTEEVTPDKYAYKTDGLYKDAPQGSENNNGSSNELYRIAKAFVTHVRNVDAESFS